MRSSAIPWYLLILNSLIQLYRLTAWKAFEFWKKEINIPLFSVIWRDGLLYFFAIFSMNLINVIIFITVPNILRVVNLTWVFHLIGYQVRINKCLTRPTLILQVILSCRLLLNLREVHASTTSKPHWQPKWSDNTKVVTNPSQSVSNLNPGGPGDPIRSTELTMFNSSAIKLEPPRRVLKDEKSFDGKVNSGWNNAWRSTMD